MRITVDLGCCMKNITLIGMPGAGKSTVGVILAKTLCWGFIDTDLLIQQKSSVPLQTIINKSGLEAFLDAEEDAVTSLSVRNHVIATGGSVVYRPKSMKHLSHSSCIVFLNVSLQELKSRIGPMMLTRGIAMKRGVSLADLFEERRPLYRSYAHFEIDCEGKCAEKVVGEIVSRIAAANQ